VFWSWVASPPSFFTVSFRLNHTTPLPRTNIDARLENEMKALLEGLDPSVK
jgi:hypothetical protein